MLLAEKMQAANASLQQQLVQHHNAMTTLCANIMATQRAPEKKTNHFVRHLAIL